MLIRNFIMVSLLVSGLAHAEQKLPKITMYTPTVCLACVDYADYLRKNGFTVQVKPTEDMEAVKNRLNVPKDLRAEPSLKVGKYFIEGHVPAEDIKEFLAEKPKARGLTVPGLPLGAPGREYSNPTCDTACTVLDSSTGQGRVRRELYNTYLVKPDGGTKVYSRH